MGKAEEWSRVYCAGFHGTGIASMNTAKCGRGDANFLWRSCRYSGIMRTNLALPFRPI